MKYLLMLALCFGQVVEAQNAVASPPNAELLRFPIMGGVLSEAEMTNLGLRVDTLKTPWIGFNWFRNVRRFAWDSLPSGTVVLVDDFGRARYKADCGNRLVEISEVSHLPDSLRLSIAWSGRVDHYHHFASGQPLLFSEQDGPMTPSPMPVPTQREERSFFSRNWGWFVAGAVVIGAGTCYFYSRHIGEAPFACFVNRTTVRIRVN